MVFDGPSVISYFKWLLDMAPIAFLAMVGPTCLLLGGILTIMSIVLFRRASILRRTILTADAQAFVQLDNSITTCTAYAICCFVLAIVIVGTVYGLIEPAPGLR